MTPIYALVMAGGRGARFWPVSRRARPKQCVHLVPGDSLLRQTVDRLQPLVPPERILVVTGPEMLDAVREELPDWPDDNILVEPSGRNTAPCIGWGAVEVQRRAGGEAVMVALPADHEVALPERLREVIRAAAEAARTTNALIAVGVRPTHPETGYGYLEVGPEMGTWGGFSFHMVERFTEKPDIERARLFVSGGDHLWNAGIFVFTVDAVRDAFRTHLPDTALALEAVQRNPDRLAELWERFDAVSIDYGIMEKSRHILTVACDMGWNDLGSWNGVARLLPETEGGRGLAEAIAAIDAQDCIVHAPGKVVALVGVRDLVVVDAGDALLVVHRDRVQEVRDVLERLETRGITGVT